MRKYNTTYNIHKGFEVLLFEVLYNGGIAAKIACVLVSVKYSTENRISTPTQGRKGLSNPLFRCVITVSENIT
jgi:hypothetical protein